MSKPPGACCASPHQPHTSHTTTASLLPAALHSLRCFKDPWQVKYEPQHKERALRLVNAALKNSTNNSGSGGGSSRRGGRAGGSSDGGSSSSRIWPDVKPPPDLLTAYQKKELLATLQWQRSLDELTASFARYMLGVVKVRQRAVGAGGFVTWRHVRTRANRRASIVANCWQSVKQWSHCCWCGVVSSKVCQLLMCCCLPCCQVASDEQRLRFVEEGDANIKVRWQKQS